MVVRLDHSIVLSPNKLSSALFVSYILGRPYGGAFARFAPVKLDDDLNIDYADADDENYERRTFRLLVTDDELDEIVARLDLERVPYGSDADQVGNKQLNSHGGGKGLVFRDPNGHTFELSTVAI